MVRRPRPLSTRKAGDVFFWGETHQAGKFGRYEGRETPKICVNMHAFVHACMHACTLLSLSAVLIYIHLKASGGRVDERRVD